jgi:TolB-like protein
MIRYISLLLFIGLAWGQENPVTITAKVDESVRPGEFVNVELTAAMDDEWHIYAFNARYAPTSISISGDAIYEIGKIIEPEPIEKFEEGFDMVTRQHAGNTRFLIPVHLKNNLKPGEYSLTATIIYSVGNSTLLYPPKKVTVDVLIIIPAYIAIFDLSGNNVTLGVCKALTERLRTELFNSRYFKVIERGMMEEILNEQGFQQTGCTSDECIVEVGRLIGVEQIVGGSISKVGRTYSVSARIVSVETGKILKTATYDFKGEIDGLLTTGMKKVAVQLAN